MSLCLVPARNTLIRRAEIHYPLGRPANIDEVLWRCEAKSYSYIVDADREEYGVTDPRLEMWWFPIQRRTPKGAWIAGRFVRLTATKRWACPTEIEALESLQARRKIQASILRNRLRRAEYELALVDVHLKPEG